MAYMRRRAGGYSGGYIETMDGAGHHVGKWDLLIAHPPCTFLSSAGSTLMFAADHSIKDMHRYNKMVEAKAFFMEFYKAEINMICIENPAPLHIAGLPPYTQIIEPYMFGHPWKKRTCLWLNGLPRLEPTNIVRPTGCWVYQGFGGPGKTNRTKLKETVGVRSAKERSKTFPGIAAAMAEQWGTPGGGYVQMSLF